MAQPPADSNVDPQVARALYIKTGVVSRLYKEEQTYRLESAEAQQNVEKLKKAKADGADIRNAPGILTAVMGTPTVARCLTPNPPRTPSEPAKALDLFRTAVQTLTEQEAVQKDCEQMVPLTVKKLQLAYEDLAHLMNGLEKDPIAETQQWADAKNVLQIVMTHWQSMGISAS